MNRNDLAIESFIGYCDEMMIAEEGMLDKLKKKMISISSAKNVKSVAEMKSNMYGEEPLLHLTGENKHQLKNIFKKLKKGGVWGSISAGVSASNGYTTGAHLQQETLKASGESDAMLYKAVEVNGETYLVHKKYKLQEAK